MSADQGFATPAALVFSLALALIAAALVQRSTAELRLARADFQSFRTQSALDGAHLAAVAAIVRSGAGGPYRWAISTDAGWVDVVAEQEATKVGLATASTLENRLFEALGVADADALRARLAASANVANPVDVGRLDAAPLWRACAATVISSLGRGEQLVSPTWQEPRTTAPNPAWRVGELWRLSITTAAGWRDDRIVRFTGDALHPAAVVVRRWTRGNGGQGQCDAGLTAA